ncbi:MAG TPA: magnesium transporter [Acidimicrobiales bacterium]|nr:magnesium transporter [Acidimicrobiales bacterium]
MRRLLRPAGAALRALFGPGTAGARQGLVALVVSATTGTIAGITLGSVTGTLESLPGLLVLVPAAIALRGNIFGAFGSRLSTSIHAGTFGLTRRVDTVVGQNVIAAAALSLVLSVVVAALAKGVAVSFGIAGSMSLADFIVISVVGGMLASVVIGAIALALAAGSARFGWDLDNVSAPIVSSAGDLVTIPSLMLAASLAGIDWVTPAVAVLVVGAAVVALVAAWRASLPLLHRLLIESLPLLAVVSLLSLFAGITIEKRLGAFLALPALLALVPNYLGTAGSLGGILSSRLSTKLHLGLVEPDPLPSRAARRDMQTVLVLAVLSFTYTGAVAHFAGTLAGLASPGLIDMIAVTLLGGLLANVFLAAVAYYGTIVAVRFGLDPDTYGIPVVTSMLDLVGAFTLIFAIVALGVV